MTSIHTCATSSSAIAAPARAKKTTNTGAPDRSIACRSASPSSRREMFSDTKPAVSRVSSVSTCTSRAISAPKKVMITANSTSSRRMNRR